MCLSARFCVSSFPTLAVRFLVAALLLLAALPAQAQVPTEVARWSAEIVPGDVGVGQGATLRVSVDLDPDWKLYALDTPPPSPELLLSARADEAVTIGEFSQPDPLEEVDPFLEVTVRIFRDQDGVFTAPIQASAPGTYTVAADLRFTVCDKKVCLPPTKHTVEATFVVGEGGERWLRQARANRVQRFPI